MIPIKPTDIPQWLIDQGGNVFTLIGAGRSDVDPLLVVRGTDSEGNTLSEWEPTADERQAIADGANLQVMVRTYGHNPQPVAVMIGGHSKNVAMPSTPEVSQS